MSLYRFVYYSAVIGGWAAFVAWLLAETLVLRGEYSVGFGQNVVSIALVGAILGAGLNLLAGLGNPQWKRQLYRLLAGLICGGIGGIVGSLLGNLFFLIGLSRAFGWAIMGLAIGSAAGIYEKSPSKCRNGVIGGAIGGLLGGFLFDHTGAGMAARATAFVILGGSIGALIGLTQLVLKEAWLTVVDGFRPGRELILGQTVTMLGRGDHLALPFLGYPGRDLESEHARIVRQTDGSFTLEDNRSRLGTRLNGQPILVATPLKDGDLVKLGTNIIRFNLRQRGSVRAAAQPAVPFPPGSMSAPPPPVSPPASSPPSPSSGMKPPAPPPPPPASPSSFPSGAIKPPATRVGRPPPPPATNPPVAPRIPPPPPPPAPPG